jgi:uroporphyrinogen III methyltransferase/synthase
MSESTASLNAPLRDLRVLVTRALQQAELLTELLTKLGAKVVEIPVISIEQPDSWIMADNSLHNLSKYDWIIFASSNAVNSLLSRCSYLGIAKERLTNCKLAAMGKATAAALEKHGLEPNFVPTTFVAESFIEEFPGYPDGLKGARILWPRTNIGRNLIADKFVFAGAAVDVIETYKTTSPEDQDEVAAKLAKLLKSNGVDVIVLASGQSVRNLAELAVIGLMREEAGTLAADAHSRILSRYLDPVIIVTIGPQTSLAAKDSLGRVDVEAQEHTTEGIIKALIEHVEGCAARD